MEISEKELEDIIFEAASKKDTRADLIKRGLDLPFNGKMYRQVNFGDYGIADLIHVSIFTNRVSIDRKYRCLQIEIIELKKNTISAQTVCQAYRYLKAIQELIEELNTDQFVEINQHITLIGSEIDKNSDTSFVYLYNGLEDMVDIYTYSLKYDGIWFEKQEHSWYKPNPDFPLQLKQIICHPSYSDLKAIIDFRHE